MQAALDFGVHDRIDRAVDDLTRVVRDAVESITLMVAAGVCGVRTTALTDALANRDGRRIPAEWAIAIGLIAPEEFRRAIATALIAPLGYSLTAQRPRTDGEKLAALRLRLVEKLGPVGADLARDDL